VSQQCPRANIYGFHAGTESPSWTLPWLPVPIMGNYAGMDRPVKFDVYASTERVYVFVEDRPAGCAVLPAGRMPAGDVTVVFGAAGYHIEIDEHVEPEGGQHEYWHRYSVGHVERRHDQAPLLPHVRRGVTTCGQQLDDRQREQRRHDPERGHPQRRCTQRRCTPRPWPGPCAEPV